MRSSGTGWPAAQRRPPSADRRYQRARNGLGAGGVHSSTVWNARPPHRRSRHPRAADGVPAVRTYHSDRRADGPPSSAERGASPARAGFSWLHRAARGRRGAG